LSNRLLTQDLAKEILTAWFNTAMGEHSKKAIKDIKMIEADVS
jgi:ribose 5-phosphate isomerase B